MVDSLSMGSSHSKDGNQMSPFEQYPYDKFKYEKQSQNAVWISQGNLHVLRHELLYHHRVMVKQNGRKESEIPPERCHGALQRVRGLHADRCG